MLSESNIIMKNTKKILYKYLGRVSYSRGLNLQEKIQKMMIDGQITAPGVILFLTHDPVITTGKHGNENNLLVNSRELQNSGIEFVRTSRGGDATYHGPGQLVCYPLINLRRFHLGVRSYIQSLENIIIKYLSGLGVECRTVDGLHGVWAGNQKIASVGVRVKRHVTMHGFALNISNDLSPFGFINPCGMEGASITSVKELTGKSPDLSECAETIIELLVQEYNAEKSEDISIVIPDFAWV